MEGKSVRRLMKPFMSTSYSFYPALANLAVSILNNIGARGYFCYPVISNNPKNRWTSSILAASFEGIISFTDIISAYPHDESNVSKSLDAISKQQVKLLKAESGSLMTLVNCDTILLNT